MKLFFLHMEKWRKSAKVWSILFLWPLDEARETFIYLYTGIYLLTCSWINILLSVKYTYLINLQVSQVKCTWWVYYQWFLILISSSGGTVEYLLPLDGSKLTMQPQGGDFYQSDTGQCQVDRLNHRTATLVFLSYLLCSLISNPWCIPLLEL